MSHHNVYNAFLNSTFCKEHYHICTIQLKTIPNVYNTYQIKCDTKWQNKKFFWQWPLVLVLFSPKLYRLLFYSKLLRAFKFDIIGILVYWDNVAPKRFRSRHYHCSPLGGVVDNEVVPLYLKLPLQWPQALIKCLLLSRDPGIYIIYTPPNLCKII